MPQQTRESAPRVAEFFAGIGLVRIGLEAGGFDVIWSNDIEPAKRDMYVGHFGEHEQAHSFVLGDVAKVTGGDMPSSLSLAWASFPCIDLSLAGWRKGLDGSHSSTFWGFSNVIDEMPEDQRPPVVVLENVIGLATSHGGKDLAAAVSELNRLGYSADVLTLDARRFVPQSRPRLFVVGMHTPPDSPAAPFDELRPAWLQAPFRNPDLRTHRAPLPSPPPLLSRGLASVVEHIPADDPLWWDETRTAAFMTSLSPIQAGRLHSFTSKNELAYRTAYRRTRDGKPVWEIRQDDVSGCLRTARGGSSRQALVQVGQGSVKARWMTPLEYARLMGAPGYTLTGLRNNQALFGFGDAVCVPVVAWLAEHYLMPAVTGTLTHSADEPLAVAT